MTFPQKNTQEQHVVALGFQAGQLGSRLALNHHSACWVEIKMEFLLIPYNVTMICYIHYNSCLMCNLKCAAFSRCSI